MRVAYKNEPIKGIILKFADGDTVKVITQCNHCGTYRALYVRLMGIESYELRSKDSILAKQIAHKYTAKYRGKEVTIIAVRTSSDKYARIIGEIYIDSEPLTKILVRANDAWHSGA